MKRILILSFVATSLFILSVEKSSAKDNPSSVYLKSRAASYDDPEIQRSLESLQKTVPLTYNKYVKNYIKYLSGKKSRFSRMLGLSRYYFPIYEKIFKECNVPDEIKYLSVVESSLNPQAVSSAGATGPWQFIHQIGRIYGLAVNDSIDERKDPVLACHAAASYILDSYSMYGDWLLAIASYNCGRNNIKWAMEKAGGESDYWTIRQYLPVETQNYVPAYIATVYIMNNYKKYGIRPQEAYFSIETDVLQLDKPVSMEMVAKQTGVSLDELSTLNPAYSKLIINGSPQTPRSLVLPVLPFESYSSLCKLLGVKGTRNPDTQLAAVKPAGRSYFIMYRVQEGDSISSIADKFSDTSEEEIRGINNLLDSSLKPGVILKIRQYKS
ncbi:transglycosylase SLT domain-containing protein [Rubrolithibacter danxiaensis]|uniref:lytic transglycosylase domain-containing protein n=1 Tax=Rubrolithibacter danxiaensis TaxID=3390805 RepID=UPI003BF80175